MTYRELLEKLQQLTDEQLGCDVTVEEDDESECYAAKSLYITDDEHDSLDDNHPVILF